MGPVQLLAKLEKLRDLIQNKAPEQLDQLADIVNKFEGAIRDAAAFLKQTRASATDDKFKTRLTDLQNDLKAMAGPEGGQAAVTALPPGMKELLAGLLLKVIDQLYGKLFPSGE
jgi:hypothetical protein